MRVAVVGGGVFGCTIAVDLARAGATVDLFEARSDILDGATARCQARLHSGYHYPRSDSTAAAARDAAPAFAARFPEAIRTGAERYYVIADDSRVDAQQYLAFCDRLGLPYELADPPQVHRAQLTVRVPEAFVDVDMLRRLLRRDLSKAGVNLHVGSPVESGPQSGYDLTVFATYGQPWPSPLRYEICETVLVELGRYDQESFVVLDGEYTSLDPYGRGHMLYDVKHSVHHANVGYEPEIPAEYRGLLKRLGPVRTSLTRFDEMVESAGRYLRGLDPGGRGVCIYAGSLFSVRAVLPDVDATDERPTLVQRSGSTVSVLSGKICTAVAAARQVTEMALGGYAVGGVVHRSAPFVIQPCELVVPA